MKRNWDTIRYVLMTIESEDKRNSSLWFTGEKDTSRDELVYHIELLLEAGLLVGEVFPSTDREVNVNIERLTWRGHEMLDEIRDQRFGAYSLREVNAVQCR